MSSFKLIIQELFRSFRKQPKEVWNVSHVSFRVQDLYRMRKFYTEVLGLSVLQSEKSNVLLGVAETSHPIIQLEQEPARHEAVRSSKLYYIGIKFLKEQHLGELIDHVMRCGVRVEASCEDSYGTAFFIQDVEHNWIKCYCPKKNVEHVYQDVHYREGTKLVLPTSYFSQQAIERYTTIPKDATLGQIHFCVPNLERAERFYTEVLPFKTTFDYISKRKNIQLNDAYYSIALNEWKPQVAPPLSNELGLHTMYLTVSTFKMLEELVQRLEKSQVSYQFEKHSVRFKDDAGTWISVKVSERE